MTLAVVYNFCHYAARCPHSRYRLTPLYFIISVSTGCAATDVYCLFIEISVVPPIAAISLSSPRCLLLPLLFRHFCVVGRHVNDLLARFLAWVADGRAEMGFARFICRHRRD